VASSERIQELQVVTSLASGDATSREEIISLEKPSIDEQPILSENASNAPTPVDPK
jgi:hypothetical protein